MKSFFERQIDDLIENGPEILKATAGLVLGCTVILMLAFWAGLMQYALGMMVTAVVGAICLLRADVRPFGKGLLGAVSITLSLLPMILFGAVFSSLG